jgi:hypothetical protein
MYHANLVIQSTLVTLNFGLCCHTFLGKYDP